MTAAAAKPKPHYASSANAGGFAVLANSVDLKTPLGVSLVVPTASLAEAIVREWQAQPDKINPASMPLTQLAATSLDIIPKERARIIEQLTAYVGSELLCHHAEEPSQLALAQQQNWQPLLAWCATCFGARLKSGTGIMPIGQTQEATTALRTAIEAYDDFRLTGLRQAIDVSGSLILGLALAEKYQTPEQIVHSAELDSAFQMQKWGEDPAILKRHSDMHQDLEICATWFDLLG